MKKVYLIILFPLLFIGNYSCKEPVSSVLINQADSLLLLVDSLNSKIVDANLDSVQTLYIQISKEHSILSANQSIKPEQPFDDEIYIELDSIMEIIGFCLEACNDFHSEVSMIENHLMRLKENILNGESSDSLILTKVEKESALLDDLTDRIIERMNLLQSNIEKYNSILPAIQQYVKEISEQDHTE